MKFIILIVKNLRRNKLRSTLTAFAVVALVAIFSMIATVLMFLNELTTEKSKDVKLWITERYKAMSVFDRSLADQIFASGTIVNRELQQIRGFHAENHTIWQFAVFSLDPAMKNQELMFFTIATLPDKIATMTEGLDFFDPRWVDLVRHPPNAGLDNAGIILGEPRLKKLNKKLGDVFTAKCVSHRSGDATKEPFEMTFEIVGVIPADNRWAEAGFIDYEYLNRVLTAQKNPEANKVAIALVQLDDLAAANAASGTIEGNIRELKSETAATAYNRFLEPLKDLLWGIKFLLVPAIFAVMTLILANTFSITVRERQTEMAVLKVMGFSAPNILLLVLGEALLIGLLAGLLGAAFTFGLINTVFGGIQLPQWPLLLVPVEIFWWGPVIGLGTALIGGVWPAWTARGVKVSEVFAKVA